MKLSRLLPVLFILVGLGSAKSANAITIRISDPVCPPDSYCVDLVWNGPTTTFGTNGQNPAFGPDDANAPFVFDVSNPPGSYPIPPTYTCDSSGIFEVNDPITSGSPPNEFLGCLFGDGTLTNGEALTLAATGGSVNLALPQDVGCGSDNAPGTCGGGVADLTAAPEPSSIMLTLVGLSLSIAALAIFDPRKRAAAEALRG